MLCHVALVRTDISEERIASIIRATRIGKLGTTLAVTSNQRALMMEAIHSAVPVCRRKWVTAHRLAPNACDIGICQCYHMFYFVQILFFLYFFIGKKMNGMCFVVFLRILYYLP
jgi:hypothetical protein